MFPAMSNSQNPSNATGTGPDPGLSAQQHIDRFVDRVLSFFMKDHKKSPDTWAKSMPQLAFEMRKGARTAEELVLAHFLLRLSQGAPPELLAKMPSLNAVRAAFSERAGERPDVLIVALENGTTTAAAYDCVHDEFGVLWPDNDHAR
jgi:hypothetical protein